MNEPAFTWVTQLLYVVAASCFVLGLHLMNTPATARRGNQLSTGGMVLAVVVTFALIIHNDVISATGWTVMLIGALLGGGAGLYAARTIAMTAMPQLVSVFNAVGGGAAALVAINDYVHAG
ncbi:MAG TPA: NAD(P)(+) transhydrogenase (Re/Si-specific) subunit beta, partial [Streptosporangiaceae bacterium]